MEVYKFKRPGKIKLLWYKMQYKMSQFKQLCFIKARAIKLVWQGEIICYHNSKTKRTYWLTGEAYYQAVIRDMGETAWLRINGEPEYCDYYFSVKMNELGK